MEAQENVGYKVAEQMSDNRCAGGHRNAVNFPSISAEGKRPAETLRRSCGKLGSFAGQLTDTGIKKVRSLTKAVSPA